MGKNIELLIHLQCSQSLTGCCVSLQVYLMAAYLVGRWAWARYQERQQRPKFDGRRKSPKDDSLF